MFHLIMQFFLDRVGGRLLLRNGSLLPARCAVCDREVRTPPRRLRLKSGAVGAGTGRITIYFHLCEWHASRRILVIGSMILIASICGFSLRGTKDGVPPTTSEFAAGIILAISVLILINSLVHNLYFRGLSFEGDKLAIKGFGQKFRDYLQPEEIRIINAEEFAAMKNPSN